MFAIDNFEPKLSELKPGPEVDALKQRLGMLRTRHAKAIERVKKYHADQRVESIGTQLRGLETDRALLEQTLKELDELITATGPSTRYNANGGQVGSSPGDPAANDRYKQRRELLWQKRIHLEESMRQLNVARNRVAAEYQVK